MADVSMPVAMPAMPAQAVQTAETTKTQGNLQEQSVTPRADVRHKIKVDGQELELPLSEILTLAQQGKGASKRFQEAAAARKEAEQIIQFAKENPKEFFAKTGMNARQWAEEFLLGEIQREAMSPEQKKAYENEERLKKYEADEKSAKEKAQSEQMQALERQHMENYDKIFVEALNTCGLPKTPFTVMRMAQLTLSAERNKIPVTPEQVAKLVREDYISEQKALFGAADGEALLEMLGKDVVKKLSKAQLSKYKSAKANVAVKPPESKADKKVDHAAAWKAFKAKTRSL